MHLKKPKSHFCNEKFMIANTEIFHFADEMVRGTHRISLEMNTPEAQADFAFGGVKVYNFCDTILGEMKSVFATLEIFVGGLSDHPRVPIIGSHVPPYMEKANIEFIK